MAERLPDGTRTRDVGDLVGPAFEVRFFNLVTQRTSVQLTDEEINRARSEGLTRGDRRNLLGTSFVLLGGVLGTSLGAGATATGQTVLDSVDRDRQIENILPKVAASLSAESKAGSPFRFVVTLTPEYEDGLLILNSRLFTYNTVAEVRWGYATGGEGGGPVFTDWHLFRNVYPKVNFGENISIVLDGFDIGSDVARQHHTCKEWDRTETPTDYDIIKALITRNRPYRIFPDINPANKADLASLPPALQRSDLFKKKEEKLDQTLSDWAFIQSLIRRAGGLSTNVVGRTFYIFSLINVDSERAESSYTFRWRQQLEGPRDVPIYSSTCNLLNGYFQPTVARGLLALDFDDEAGEPTARRLVPSDADHREPVETSPDRHLGGVDFGTGTGSIAVADDRGEKITSAPETKTPSCEPVPSPARKSDNSVDARAETLIAEGGVLSSPKVKIKAPGIPDLFPGRIVTLAGLTDLFDGPYIVHAVKHMVSSSGYDMDVELIRYSAVVGESKEPNRVRVKEADGTDTRAEPDPGGANEFSGVDFTGGGGG